MLHLREITKGDDAMEGYPFDLPAIRTLARLELTAPVTFLTGANASGKSTLLEAIAIASGRVVVGGTDLKHDPSLDAIRPLAQALKLTWSKRTARGFFLRAEDFFNFARRNRELTTELQGYADKHADDPRVQGYLLGQKRSLERRYGDLNAASHGEGFLRVFQTRLVPQGLYLLDEPEAALSPQSQLAFLIQLHDAVAAGSQFLIATHSPIVASFPGAGIFEFGPNGLRSVAYDDLESVSLYRHFLRNPKQYLDRLFRE
jgi:predicted ATPase